MASIYELQTEFSSAMSRLFDGAFLSNTKKLLYPVGCGSAVAENAEKICSLFQAYRLRGDICEEEGEHREIACGIYSGRCKAVDRLAFFLKIHLQEHLVNAFVHGSLATDEEVNYSDFDALLIFKDDVFCDAQKLTHVVKRVLQARKFLFDYDPFQHHGFFVLCESDLNHYPENVFPLVLFDYSKSLLYDRQPLSISLVEKNGIKNPLQNMLNSINRRLQPSERPTRLYELKSMLSHIMLLPCLILQTEGVPVFKRDSFERIKNRFSQGQWRSVEIASAIRQEWPDVTGKLTLRIIRALGNTFHSSIYQKKIGVKIPSSISRVLKESDFFDHTKQFVEAVNRMVTER